MATTEVVENALVFSPFSKMIFKIRIIKKETGAFWKNIAFPFPIRLKFLKRRDFKNGVQFRFDETSPAQYLFDHTADPEPRYTFNVWTSGQEDKSKEKRSNFKEKWDDDDDGLHYRRLDHYAGDRFNEKIVDYIIERYPNLDFTPEVDRGVVTFDGNWDDEALPTGEDYSFESEFKRINSTRVNDYTEEVQEFLSDDTYEAPPDPPPPEPENLVSDPREGTSNFSTFQNEVCDSFLLPEDPEAEVEMRVCPTCIPNIDFVPQFSHWYQYELDEVWLNEATCEYNVSIKAPVYLQTSTGDSEVEFVLEKYESANDTIKQINDGLMIREGILKILSYRNKIITDNIVCANPPLTPEGECGIRFLQKYIDEIKIETQIPSGQNNGTTVSVYGVNTQLIDTSQTIRNPSALELFARIRNYGGGSTYTTATTSTSSTLKFHITVPASLVDSLPDDSISEIAEDVQDDDLEVIGPDGEIGVSSITFKGSKTKGLFKKRFPQAFEVFSEYQAFFFHTSRAKIKIYTNYDSSIQTLKHYYAKRYVVKFEQFYNDLKKLIEDNYYNLTNDDNRFRQAYEIKISFEEATLQKKYAIKSVHARYLGCPFKRCSVGFSRFKKIYDSQETLMSYVSKHKEMASTLETGLPPWLDFLKIYTSPAIQVEYGNQSNSFEAQGCLDNLNSSESFGEIFNDLVLDSSMSFSKALEFSINSLNCRSIENYDPLDFQKSIQSAGGAFSENAEILKLLGDYRKFGEDLYGVGPDVVGKTKDAYSRMIKDKQKVERNFFERLTGKSIQEFMDYVKTNPKEASGELLQKINPCNWQAISLDIVLCMMKGLKPIDILRKTARSLMGNLDMYELEEVFNGLPEETKNEILGIISNLPLPWVMAREAEARKKQNQTENDYVDNRDPPTPPGEVAQISATELENLKEADNNKEAIKEEIKAIEEAIKKLSKTETELDTLGAEYDALGEQIAKYDTWINNSIGPTATYVLKRQDVINERDELGERLGQVYIDFQELERLRTELRQKQQSLIGSRVAQANALLELADAAENPNEYEKAARQIIELVAGAIIDATITSLGVDDLKDLVDSLPGSEIFVPIVTAAFCPEQQILGTWVDATFAGLEIEPCKSSSWYIPTLPYIPELEALKVLKLLLQRFVQELVKRIVAALVAFLTKSLQATLDLTCDIFEGVGGYLMDLSDHDEGDATPSLFDAIADAFCTPNVPGSSFANTIQPRRFTDGQRTFGDLVQSYGGRVSQDVVLSWGESLSETATVAMWKELFVTGTSSTGMIDVAWDVTENFEELQDLFQTKDDLRDFFNNIKNLVDEDYRQSVLDFLDQIDQGTTLTEFCQLYCGDIPVDSGFREGIITDDFKEISGPEFGKTFEDLLDAFFRGPDEDILNVFDYGTGPFGNDAFCEDVKDLYNSDNLTGKQPLLSEPDIFKEVRKEVGDTIFSDLEMAYVRDLIESKDSFFNNLLADRDNKKLTRGTMFDPSHEFREKQRFLFPNAANSYDEHKNKWKTARFNLRLAMRIADNISDAVDTANKEGETSGGSFKSKITAFVGDIFKPIMAFIELFKISKPKPTNRFPKTVGKAYYDTLRTSKAQYESKNEFLHDGEITTTDKLWISLGFNSKDVQIKKPTIKKADISLTYKNSNGDYKLISGFSPYTTKKTLAGENIIDIELTEQSYSLFVREKLISKFNPFLNTDEDGNVVTTPLNRMLKSTWDTMFGDLPFLEEQTTTSVLNDIKVPYDLIDRYPELYVEYMQKYFEEYGEQVLVSELSSTRSNQGETIPPNRWILMQYMVDRTIASGNSDNAIGDLAYNIAGTAGNADVYYDEDGETYYSSDSRIDRIYQDIIRQLMAKFLKLGEIQIAGQYSQGVAFGYDLRSKIQFPDLLYVNPDSQPEDPRTWYYDKDEDEKVLGKSATENPRVMFLDPDIYGGKFTKPKIYIKPASHTGVMGLMQQYLPEDDGCEPASRDMLFLEDVRKKVEKLEVEIKRDKRMSYDPDCVNEPPFDLVADPSSHAYLHGVVITTIRTYIMETFLRCAPIVLQLTPSSANFDKGLAYFVMDNMRQGLMDTPSKSLYLKYGKLEYWYLFLEQMVQTTERELMAGNIVDNRLQSKLNTINAYRKGYYQPDKKDRKILSLIKRVVRDENGNVSAVKMKYGYDIPDSYQTKFVDMIDAVSFCAFGKNFKQYLKNKELKFHGGRILTLKQIRKYCKIYAIWKKEDDALFVSSFLVLEEFKKYVSLYKNSQNNMSPITSMSKFMLNSKSGVAFGPYIKAGEESVESLDASQVSNELYGRVLDIGQVHSQRDIFSGKGGANADLTTKAESGFLVEKYFRVTLNPYGAAQPVYNQWERYNGKRISVSRFQSVWREFREQGLFYFDDDSFISDHFGNAETNATGDGLKENTSIGIKFGVRLSLVTSHGARQLAEESAGLYTQFDDDRDGHVCFRDFDTLELKYIPSLELLSYEQDVLDQPIENYVANKVPTENGGEKIKCYIDRMCELKEFNFIMEYLFPVKTAVSLMMVNAYYGYVSSIGDGEGERDPTADAPDEEWKSEILKNLKKKLRSLFSSYYDSKEIDPERGQREKHSLEFKKLSMPDINKNIDLKSIPSWMRGRFYNRPFSKKDQECLPGALGSMSQILPDQKMAFKNDVDQDEPYVPADGDGGAPYISHPPNAAAELTAQLVAEGKLEQESDGYYTAIGPSQGYDPNGMFAFNPFTEIMQEQPGSQQDPGQTQPNNVEGVEVTVGEGDEII